MHRSRIRKLVVPTIAWIASALGGAALLAGRWRPAASLQAAGVVLSLLVAAAAIWAVVSVRNAAWRAPRAAPRVALALLPVLTLLAAAGGGFHSPALAAAALCCLVTLRTRTLPLAILVAAALALVVGAGATAVSGPPPVAEWLVGVWTVAALAVLPHALLGAARAAVARERRRNERLSGLVGDRARTPVRLGAIRLDGKRVAEPPTNAPSSKSIVRASSHGDVVARYLRDVRDWADAEEVIFWRLDERAGEILPDDWSTAGDRPLHMREDWLPLVSWSTSERLAQSLPAGDRPQISICPVECGMRGVGTLTVTNGASLGRSRDELAVWMPRFAAHAAAVSELVRERDVVARRNRHAMALLGATRDFPAVQSTDKVAQALFANVLSLTAAQRACLVRWQPDEGRGSVEYLTPGHPLAERTTLTDRSYVGGTCAGGRPLVWEDARVLEAGRRIYGEGEPRRDIGSLGVVPYFIAGEVRGALVVEGDGPGDVRAEDRRALRQLVDLAAASIERLTRTEEEALRATTDKLTGLKNRRYFDEQFVRESARVFRSGSSLALVMGDVDHFKRINDGHGHDAGDAVLRAIAARFGQAIRDVDIAARLGGEEFVVLLPETDLDGALKMAERLRQSIEARPVTAGAMDIHVTMSFGVAAFPRSSPTREGILAAADRALYRAKSDGRNCVRSAPPKDYQTKA